MLTQLSINNYALIHQLSIDFSSGLSIITGETGAGKSILLGALGLVLGNRADLSSLKDTSTKCIVEAKVAISNYNLQDFFKEVDLDYELETIIRREILPSGKSRAFVNDSPVVLNQLTAISKYIIDIHSQHQNLDLVNVDFQFDVIDSVANNSKILREYKLKLFEYKTLLAQLSSLKHTKSELSKAFDYNNHLLEEINGLNISNINLNDLENSHKVLNSISSISQISETKPPNQSKRRKSQNPTGGKKSA